MWKYFGGFGLAVALLALAQRLGGYENKPLAVCLAILAVLLILFLIFFGTRDIAAWTRSRRVLGHIQIRIEIIEGFFTWGPFESSEHTSGGLIKTSNLAITLNVRLTNLTAPDPTAIASCSLAIQARGRLLELNPEGIILPRPHAIDRPTRFHMGHEGLARKHKEILPDLDMTAPLKRGMPISGLIQFVVHDLEKRTEDDFQDEGVFTLRLVDVFGHSYELVRPAKPWPKTGELIPMPPA